MGPAIQALQETLSVKGYAVVGHFLPLSDCEKLRVSLEKMIEKDLSDGLRDPRDSYMVHNPMLRDDIFLELLKQSVMTEVLSAILGKSFILYAFTTSSLPPHGTNWARRIHVDCPRLIRGYSTNMNVFIPLDQMNPKNGGIELLPESQWLEDEPTEQTFSLNKVVPELEIGSLLIFYSRLWHSAGLNTTPHPRHAVTMNFCRSFMRQRFDYPRMFKQSQAESLDETQRQLLGFNVRVPTSLEEYYLPEEQRLYKQGQG